MSMYPLRERDEAHERVRTTAPFTLDTGKALVVIEAADVAVLAGIARAAKSEPWKLYFWVDVYAEGRPIVVAERGERPFDFPRRLPGSLPVTHKLWTDVFQLFQRREPVSSNLVSPLNGGLAGAVLAAVRRGMAELGVL